MKSKMNKKDIFVNCIFLIFTILFIFILFKADSKKDFVMSSGGLLFFGGGGIVYFFLKNNFGSGKLIDDKTTIIYESKQKVFFYFLGGLVFVIMGIIMIIYNSYFDSRRMNPQIAFFIGIVSISFFGLIFLASFIRLVSPARKLIEITQSTLEIQTGLLKNEMIIIPKDEIEFINENKISSNSFISIYVNQPEKYIKKGFLKNMNYKLTGTPININPNISNFSSDEVLKFLNKNINIEN